MRISHLIRFSLVITILLSAVCQALAESKALELSLSFDKAEYKKTDAISVTFKLENKGKKPVYVNERFYVNSKYSSKEHREIYLSVTSPSGEELAFNESRATDDVGLPKTDYFVLLEPGEEVILERPRNIKYYFDFDEPGTYKIVGVYQNSYGDEIGLDVFKKKVQSEPLEIKIVE